MPSRWLGSGKTVLAPKSGTLPLGHMLAGVVLWDSLSAATDTPDDAPVAPESDQAQTEHADTPAPPEAGRADTA